MAHGSEFSSLSSVSSEISSVKNPVFVFVEERFKCPLCHQILRNPMQASCGHRMCEECIANVFVEGSPATCPASDKEDPCEPIYENQVFRDASARREIAQLPVHCENASLGCKQTPAWKELDKHLSQCPYKGTDCPNKEWGCNQILPLKDIEAHVRSTCDFRQVSCRLCQQTYTIKNQKKHQDEECPEQTISCPHKCGASSMKRKNLPEHLQSCPKRPHECEFKSAGCPFVGTEMAVKEHMEMSINKHLELVTVYTGRIELQNVDIQTKLQDITRERNVLKEQLVSRNEENEQLKTKVGTLEKTMKELRLKQVGLFERVIKIERRFDELPRRELLEQQSRDLQSVKQRVEELQNTVHNTEGGQVAGRFGSLSNMADSMTTQLTTHDRQIGIHDVRIAEMDLRFQILETASYDGVLLWKIRDYTRRKQEAVSGRTLSLYSQPFYTHKYGYKMCARVYLNGDGMGKTTHISLFFVIMRGEYDSLLPWPFGQKVTLYLLDQGLERRHLSDHFHPDPSSSSFRKPQTEMNIASGCPLFVSHSVLENPASNYLKDDTIFIKVAVETANLRTV